MTANSIKISAVINAPVEPVCECWIGPEHICGYSAVPCGAVRRIYHRRDYPCRWRRAAALVPNRGNLFGEIVS